MPRTQEELRALARVAGCPVTPAPPREDPDRAVASRTRSLCRRRAAGLDSLPDELLRLVARYLFTRGRNHGVARRQGRYEAISDDIEQMKEYGGDTDELDDWFEFVRQFRTRIERVCSRQRARLDDAYALSLASKLLNRVVSERLQGAIRTCFYRADLPKTGRGDAAAAT